MDTCTGTILYNKINTVQILTFPQSMVFELKVQDVVLWAIKKNYVILLSQCLKEAFHIPGVFNM